ncbi:hypothetical protein A1359_13760 [Methylomonas lenta]|uniref:Uncharacterized protein n=1 Tax=Methylomonas lenta TaxID=980561 RepID=A0A177N3N3_9GAMM|nr:hypothetical protein [Methylomonas lenta]OAI12598.1 hypothetical protein A1359_13760 [Methylomonas lenta]
MTNNINALAELRRQGLEADIYKARLRVFPRRRMTRAVCRFVTANLAAIVDGLIAEQAARTSKDEFLWDLPMKIGVEHFGFEIDAREIIPQQLNGELFGGVPAPSV